MTDLFNPGGHRLFPVGHSRMRAAPQSNGGNMRGIKVVASAVALLAIAFTLGGCPKKGKMMKAEAPAKPAAVQLFIG